MHDHENFYRLEDLSKGVARTLAPGLEARIFAGENVMVSVLRVAPNAAGTVHRHPEEQWGLLLEGSGVRMQGGHECGVAAGSFWRTPPNMPHSFRAGADGALLVDIFSPPREEYRVSGSGFGGAEQLG